MSTPLRISDEILKPAREEADLADRSLTSQVEHWAKVGMAVERVLGHGLALQLKKQGAAVSLEQALAHATSAAGQKQVLEHLQKTAPVRYGDDPDRPGGLIRIAADGTKTPGRFVNRVFVPHARGK